MSRQRNTYMATSLPKRSSEHKVGLILAIGAVTSAAIALSLFIWLWVIS